MTTWIAVARYHLVQRFNYLLLPGAVLAFAFAVDMIVLALIPAGNSAHRYVGGLGSIFVLVFVLGLQSVARSLPFGLALGVSRRSYYLGTAFLGLALGAVYGSALTGLQAIERATNGWGMRMGFFRVPYILDGSWYRTLLTSFVVLTLLFVYGIWFGLVYRRWSIPGMIAFIAGQITVALAVTLVATWSHTWHTVGHFFTALSATGLTGVLAACTAALLLGGFATMRRVTV
jgi:hypothetical protein